MYCHGGDDCLEIIPVLFIGKGIHKAHRLGLITGGFHICQVVQDHLLLHGQRLQISGHHLELLGTKNILLKPPDWFHRMMR